MAHRYRFFGKRLSDDIWEIDASEYNHISNVLRISKGDSVEVCDGKGSWSIGSFSKISKREISVAVEESFFEEPSLKASEIVIGVLKPQSMDLILPDLVELGVTEIHLFSQADIAKSRMNEKLVSRWNRIIEGSIKQCKRSWVPTLVTHKSLEDVMSYKSYDDDFSKFIAFHEGEALVSQVFNSSKSKVVTVVGGEKGLSDQEFKCLKESGFVEASVGPHILKAMTAAVACAAVQTYILN